MKETENAKLLTPGQNCWREEHADRLAMLVDGENYFAALHSALNQARDTVWILAWDIDSRLRLVRDGREHALPVQLLDAIKTALERNPQLEVHVLAWDFSMIYALEREWRPLFNGNWNNHGRLHFHMDDHHPVAASQHQKIVVVDDALAFVGGIDPSKWRWDTSEHRAAHPQRIDPEGKPYPPFHDIMLAVDGNAARALGELARERWRLATGKSPRPPSEQPAPVWPEGVSADFEDLEVAIARTLPPYQLQAEVREIERSFIDAIESAQHHIYIESQYFSGYAIGEAIAKRLEEAGSPEVVVVMPREKDGWLEHMTMDVLRARLVERIRKADKHERFRTYYPDVPNLEESCVSLHSKLLIVDDRLLHAGSANVSNRSMGLDSECNLIIEAANDRQRDGIARCRARLLAEHLGTDPQTVLRHERETGSLIETIERLGGGRRSLRTLDTSVPEEVDRQIPDTAILDPERPVDPDTLIDEFIGREVRRPAGKRMLGIGLVLLAFVGMAAVWRWTPLGGWLTPETLGEFANDITGTVWGHIAILLGFVIAALLAVPVTLLITATAIAFGPALGFVYALVASIAASALSYGLGQALGRKTLRRMAGGRLNSLSRRLGNRGILTMVTVRIVPVAPFIVINLVAGASHIRFRDFMIGTTLGIIPGIVGLTLFADGLLSAVRDPGPKTLSALAGIAALVAVGALWLGRWARSRQGETS